VVPSDVGELAAEHDDVVDELTAVLDELREIARGIHPAVLVEGGRNPTLKALARRSPYSSPRPARRGPAAGPRPHLVSSAGM
jgi:hypothetical protein